MEEKLAKVEDRLDFTKKNYKDFLIEIQKNTFLVLQELGLTNNLNSAHKIINKIINTDEKLELNPR